MDREAKVRLLGEAGAPLLGEAWAPLHSRVVYIVSGLGSVVRGLYGGGAA